MIGLSDGLTVPFALAAGLSSLGTSKIVVIGGIAELIAGAISMGIGGFLASQAERDHYRYQKYALSHRVSNVCVNELEREVSKVLSPVGVDERTCRMVTDCLRDVEERNWHQSGPSSGLPLEVERLRWSQSGGVGLTAFLLKFGLGLGIQKFVCLFSLTFLLMLFFQKKFRIEGCIPQPLQSEWDTSLVALYR